jgi:hypothetical protein
MRITVLLYPNRKSTNPLLDEGSASNPAMCSYTQLGAAISRVQSDANHRCRSHVEGGDRVGVGYEADSTVQRLVYAKENGSAIALNFHGVRDWILPAVVLTSCHVGKVILTLMIARITKGGIVHHDTWIPTEVRESSVKSRAVPRPPP